jgi:hypothetical protein
LTKILRTCSGRGSSQYVRTSDGFIGDVHSVKREEARRTRSARDRNARRAPVESGPGPASSPGNAEGDDVVTGLSVSRKRQPAEFPPIWSAQRDASPLSASHVMHDFLDRRLFECETMEGRQGQVGERRVRRGLCFSCALRGRNSPQCSSNVRDF